MKKFTWILYAAIILLFTAGISTATVLDFDDFTNSQVPSGGDYDDFTWNNFLTFNGYVHNHHALGTASVTILPAVGSLFNFYGADFQNGSFNWPPSQMTGLTITGIGFNNQVGTASMNLTGNMVNGIMVYDWDNLDVCWENLISLIITPTGTNPLTPELGAFNMDNFNYTTNAAAPVPEPATVLLLGLGLLGLVGFKKKFRK